MMGPSKDPQAIQIARLRSVIEGTIQGYEHLAIEKEREAEALRAQAAQLRDNASNLRYQLQRADEEVPR